MNILFGQVFLNLGVDNMIGLRWQRVLLNELIEHLWDIGGLSDGKDRVVDPLPHVDIDSRQNFRHWLLDLPVNINYLLNWQHG